MVVLETVQLRISCTKRVEAAVGVLVPKSIARTRGVEGHAYVLALGIAFAECEPDDSGALVVAAALHVEEVVLGVVPVELGTKLVAAAVEIELPLVHWCSP